MASKIKVDQLEGSTGSTITIPTGQTFTVTDGIPVASGGTGLASFTAGDILYATGATTLTKLNKGTAEQVLAMNAGATAPDWGSVDLTVLPTITVAKGGTNLASFTAGDILYATGSTTLAKLAKGTTLQQLRMNAGATAPEWATVAGGGIKQVTQGVYTGVASVQSNSPTFAQFTQLTASITPASTSNKILITSNVSTGATNGYRNFWKLRFDIGGAGYNDLPILGDARGSRLQTNHAHQDSQGGNVNANHFVYLHSPSTTSALTYRWSACTEATTADCYINRGFGDSDNNGYSTTSSNIVLQEVTV